MTCHSMSEVERYFANLQEPTSPTGQAILLEEDENLSLYASSRVVHNELQTLEWHGLMSDPSSTTNNIQLSPTKCTRDDPHACLLTLDLPLEEDIASILKCLEGAEYLHDYWDLKVCKDAKGRIIEYSWCVTHTEAMAIEYVCQRTSIPIPKTPLRLRWQSGGGGSFSIAVQLHDFVTQLRWLSSLTLMGQWPLGLTPTCYSILPHLAPSTFIEEFHTNWWQQFCTYQLPKPSFLMRTGKPANVVLSHGDLTPS